MLENFHKETFEEQLNTTFQIRLENAEPVCLELISVSGHGVRGIQEQFSLLFRGPLETPFEQAMYPMHHPQLGDFNLFIVPVARNSAGFEYEAVFNRLLDEAAI